MNVVEITIEEDTYDSEISPDDDKSIDESEDSSSTTSSKRREKKTSYKV